MTDGALRKLCRAPGCDELAAPGLAHCAFHDDERRAKEAARRQAAKAGSAALAGAALYASPRWKRARSLFLAKHPLCEDCGELGVITAAREVDHRIPHRGDPKLMWDPSNWQALCKPCHSRKTAREVWHGPRG